MKLKINNRVVPFDMRKQITDLRQQLKAQREEAKECHRIAEEKVQATIVESSLGNILRAIAASHQGVEQDKKELNLLMDVSYPGPDYSKPPPPTPPLTIDQA